MGPSVNPVVPLVHLVVSPHASPQALSRLLSRLTLKKKKKEKHERMRTNHRTGESARDPPAGSQELTRTRLRAHALRGPAPQLVTSRRLYPALLAAFSQHALAGVRGQAPGGAQKRLSAGTLQTL